MTGPRIEQVECPWCPCGEPGPWVALCCGRKLSKPNPASHLHPTPYYAPTRLDAWLALANHVQSTHGITLPVEPPAAPTAPTTVQGALL